MAMLLTACGHINRFLGRPYSEPPPPSLPANDTGLPAWDYTSQLQAGQSYFVVFWCRAGSAVINGAGGYWGFEPGAGWPPAQPEYQTMIPYPVPGILKVTSATDAQFIAEVDGSTIPLHFYTGESPGPGGCMWPTWHHAAACPMAAWRVDWGRLAEKPSWCSL